MFANAVMHCGTTVDKFVQDNPDWYKKASNWAKFSAAACVGMIYKGCINSSRTVLKTYLPDGENGGAGGGPFTTGGALYALGLIHGICSNLMIEGRPLWGRGCGVEGRGCRPRVEGAG